MKNYRLQFTKIDQDNDFARLAREIDGHLESRDCIQLSGRMARGIIRKYHLDVGFYMRTWDISLHFPLELYKQALPGFSSNNSFSILYNLTPESLVLKNIGEHRQYNLASAREIFFLSDDVPVGFTVPARRPVQLIDFSFTSYWLSGLLQKNGFDNSMLHPGVINDDAPVIKIESCTAHDNLAINKLFSASLQLQKEIADMDKMHEQSVGLLNSFLTRTLISDHKDQDQCRHHEPYMAELMEVEAILQAHLQSSLPPLSHVARQVALSESTLKRYFKLKFGRSIYGYYLEKKMNLARHMLLEMWLTVNETAEMMGYEKVSNFINIFKKHHGHSPGALKRKGQQALRENDPGRKFPDSDLLI